MMSPTVAVVMLHPQCSMRCSFCITDDAMGTFSFQQACALLDRLSSEGFSSVVFGGGEPLEWPGGTFGLAREAKARGLVVQLGTNGILLTEGFERLDSIDRYVLPLDGSTSETHNAVRFYRQRHFEIITDRLGRLCAAGKSTTISTVVTRVNRADVLPIGRMLTELQATRPFLHAWHLYQFVPEGRGGALFRDQLLLAPDEYARACDSVAELKTDFRIYRRPDMLHSRTVEFFWNSGDLLHRQLGERRIAQPI